VEPDKIMTEHPHTPPNLPRKLLFAIC